MDKESFEAYIKDDQVIKFGEWQGRHYLYPDTESVVFFAFFHSAINNDWHGKPQRRIVFDTFDLLNYQGPLPLPEIKSEQYFLVNADHPDFAILFKVTIDEQAGIAKLTLEKHPELGSKIITVEERNGIELKLKI